MHQIEEEQRKITMLKTSLKFKQKELLKTESDLNGIQFLFIKTLIEPVIKKIHQTP